MTFLDELAKPFFVLAPMDDVTDTVFRQIVADCAKPDLMFTEFVNVDGLQSPGRKHLLHKLKLSAGEKPVIAQLWGLKPENFYKTTKDLIEMGFDGVDLNMGCPVKNVTKNGACAALINNRGLAGEIIDATVEAATMTIPSVTQTDAVQGAGEDRKGGVHGSTPTADRSSQRRNAAVSAGGAAGSAGGQASAVREARALPVSVKTRVGFTTVDMSWIEFLLDKKILNMLSIHARTAKQMSKVPPDYDLLGRAVELRNSLSPGTLMVGNGDVTDRQQGAELAEKYDLDGVMVGRGVFHDPFLFAAASPWSEWGKTQRLELFRNHIELYLKTYKNGERKFEPLRKFCKVYINGFEGASELRAKFMETNDPSAALELLKA
jgi:tRNA-dihydrouridine synthase